MLNRVDEVIEDAPWVVTPEYLAKHKIDSVAHGASFFLKKKPERVANLLKKM